MFYNILIYFIIIFFQGIYNLHSSYSVQFGDCNVQVWGFMTKLDYQMHHNTY